jgi:hypothetical protein
LKMDQAKRMKELEKENGKLKTPGRGAVVGQTDSKGYCGGKLLSPERRRCAVEHARQEYEVSERRGVPSGKFRFSESPSCLRWHPKLTSGLLDHAIWNISGGAAKKAQDPCCRLAGNYQTPESKLGSKLGPNADKLGPKPCTTT